MRGIGPVDTSPAVSAITAAIPLQISVEVTSRCNLACTMCVLTLGLSSTSGSDKSLPREIWDNLLAECTGAVDLVQFTGFGEPLLHKDFPQMLTDLDERGIQTAFTTNGTRLPEAFIERLGTLNLLRSVNISIDTADAEIYRKLRGGKVKKVLETIGKLRPLKGRFALSVSALAMRTTLPSLAQLPAHLQALGVEHLVVQSLYDQSKHGLAEDFGDLNSAAQWISELTEAADRHNVNLIIENPARFADDLTPGGDASFAKGAREQTRNCNLPWTSAHIDAAGTVFPCCRAAGENSEALGSLADHSLAEIWRGAAYERFRQRLGDPQLCPAVCANCTVVPVGYPAALLYKAELVPEQCLRTETGFRIAFRNHGPETWQGSKRPALGTARPQDRSSSAHMSGWLSDNRVAFPVEPVVRPGDIATYDVLINPQAAPGHEHFQLVLDGSHWLPETGIALRIDPKPEARPGFVRHWSTKVLDLLGSRKAAASPSPR